MSASEESRRQARVKLELFKAEYPVRYGKLEARLTTLRAQYTTPRRPTRPVSTWAPNTQTLPWDEATYRYVSETEEDTEESSSVEGDYSQQEQRVVYATDSDQDDDEDSRCTETKESTGGRSRERSDAISDSDEETSTETSSVSSRELRQYTRPAMDCSGLLRDGRRMGRSGDGLGSTLQQNYRWERDLPDDIETARPDGFRASQKHERNWAEAPVYDDLREDGNHPFREDGHALGKFARVLFQGNGVAPSRKRGERERQSETGPSVSILRKHGRFIAGDGNDGASVDSNELPSSSDQPKHSALDGVFREKPNAFGNMALRRDSDAKDESRALFRAVSERFEEQIERGRKYGDNDYLEYYGGTGVALFEPPRVEYKGEQVMVSFLPESNRGDPRRRTTGSLSAPSVFTDGGPYAVRSGDKRSLSLFYISGFIRHKSGRTVAILGELSGNGNTASSEANFVRHTMHEKEAIEEFLLGPQKILGASHILP